MNKPTSSRLYFVSNKDGSGEEQIHEDELIKFWYEGKARIAELKTENAKLRAVINRIPQEIYIGSWPESEKLPGNLWMSKKKLLKKHGVVLGDSDGGE